MPVPGPAGVTVIDPGEPLLTETLVVPDQGNCWTIKNADPGVLTSPLFAITTKLRFGCWFPCWAEISPARLAAI